MKKSLLKVVSVILCISMLFSVCCVFISAQTPTDDINEKYSYLTNKNINPDEISNAVVIPGVFQSKVRLYNDDGSVATDKNGKELEMPFFLEDTGSIVSLALKKCLLPLLLTLFTQHDWGGKLAKSVAGVIGEVLGGKILSDKNGEFVYDQRADFYDGSIAELREQGRTDDIKFIFDQIPLDDYASIVGEDHLYYFSYASFGNIDKIVDQLYEFILKAAENSPTGKAIVIPISQGGTLANNLLERYPQVGEVVERMIYIVPALDGTVLLGEIFEKGIIDDDEALYRDVFPILLDESTGSLINIVLRILPNSVVNAILDEAVDELVGKYLKYSTCMWALLPQANYQGAADKYLNGPDDAFIRSQTDAFHEGQVKAKDNIKYEMETYGVEVFDICDYNAALYPICDSWNSMNADGIIQLNSTSMGATSVAVDVQLPADYVPVDGGKYVDSYNLVDAGTGLLPDTTFYFHNQNHESTGSNDVIMKLAICLLTDKDFTSVNSYPDKFPQFNEGRNTKSFRNRLKDAEAIDRSKLSAEDAAELSAAIEQAEAALAKTVVDREVSGAADARLSKILNRINGISDEPTIGDEISGKVENGLTAMLKVISAALFSLLGGKGFSDIFRIF